MMQNKYSYILWTQNESTSIKDTLLIGLEDGSVFSEREFKSLPGQQDAFDVLLAQKDKCRCVGSPRNEYVQTKDGICIAGLFNEKDEVGRKMAFMFYTKTKDKQAAINELRQHAKSLGRTLNEAHMQEIMAYKEGFGSKLKKALGLTAIGIVLFIIIKLIWK